VLAGPPDVGAALWDQWLKLRGRPSIRLHAPLESALLACGRAALQAQRPLEEAASESLGQRFASLPESVRPRLSTGTTHERGVALEALLRNSPSTDATLACQCLLSAATGDRAEELLRTFEGSALRAFAALCALMPEDAWPGLTLTPCDSSSCEAMAALAESVLGRVPAFPVSLLAHREWLAPFASSSASRATTLVREGIIDLPREVASSLPEELGAFVRAVRDLSPAAHPLGRLLFEATQACSSPASDSEAADRARSAAERFLFECLECFAPTRGLFELNVSPGFTMEGRPVEVDLLSRGLRIAIEIDGWFHFRAPEDYRRDRRKDFALQRHDFIVVRFLAQDVVSELETVLATVEQAVSLRRSKG